MEGPETPPAHPPRLADATPGPPEARAGDDVPARRRPFGLLSGVASDLGRGLRSLLRTPALTATVLVSLVLALGVNVAIFTLVDALYLNPFPIGGIDRLARVERFFDDPELPGATFDWPFFEQMRSESRSFTDLVAWQRNSFNLTGGSEAERVEGLFVSGGFFRALELEPAAGRFFTEEEQAAGGGEPVVVLSHGAWNRLFGADPGVVGEKVLLNGEPATVVGVGPPGFQGIEVGVESQVFLPMSLYPRLSPFGEWFEVRGVSFFPVFGRLAEGATRASAGRELDTFARRAESDYPDAYLDLQVRAQPLLDGAIAARARDQVLGLGRNLVFGVALVLVIACINIAHLLAVRGLGRRRELATRMAVGADRRRITRQLLTETTGLFLVGALASLPVAWLVLRFLWSFRPPDFSASGMETHLDLRALGVALVLALAAGLLAGVWPAIRSVRRADLQGVLREGERSTSSRRRFGLRDLLVVPQIALALLALIAAGLFLQAVAGLRDVDLGFDGDRIAVVTVGPGIQGWEDERVREHYRRMLETASSMPGVERAALSENRLLRGAILRNQIYAEGENVPPEGDSRPLWRTNTVSVGYFETAGIPIVEGRAFDESDREDGLPVVIVNEYLAELLWPGESAVGKRASLGYPTEPKLTVVGVARDAKYRQIHEDPQGFIYLPLGQNLVPQATLHARTSGDPAALVEPLRREIRALAPDLPVADAATLRSFVDEGMWMERVSSVLLSVFGVLALLLATLGVYGMMRYSVGRRRREIGVRMAFGATRGEILRAVLGDCTKVILLGLGLGLLVAFSTFERLMAEHLTNVAPIQPGLYLLQALLILAVALAGAWAVARRASRIAPAEVLRQE